VNKDHEIFLNEINNESKVLEVGCGEGDFLSILKNKKNCKCYGLEIESDRVASGLEKGLSIIQGDADYDLINYPDKNNIQNPFDFLIMANSLQVMKKPYEVLCNAKRTSDKILISIPNFGYYKNRLYLGLKGRMPVTSRLSFEWYETPNIHFSTIRDFIEMAEKIGLEVEKSYYVRGRGKKAKIVEFNSSKPSIANIFGHQGIFILK
jgi:methionine biosynthesis protein MetW